MAVTSVNAAAFLLDRLVQTFGVRVAGLSGFEDFVALVIGTVATSFMPWCQLNRGHLAVHLFGGTKSNWRGWDVIGFVVVCFLTWSLILGLIETAQDGTRTPILGWDVWPFMIAPVISLSLWALVLAFQIFERDNVVA